MTCEVVQVVCKGLLLLQPSLLLQQLLLPVVATLFLHIFAFFLRSRYTSTEKYDTRSTSLASLARLFGLVLFILYYMIKLTVTINTNAQYNTTLQVKIKSIDQIMWLVVAVLFCFVCGCGVDCFLCLCVTWMERKNLEEGRHSQKHNSPSMSGPRAVLIVCQRRFFRICILYSPRSIFFLLFDYFFWSYLHHPRLRRNSIDFFFRRSTYLRLTVITISTPSLRFYFESQ